MKYRIAANGNQTTVRWDLPFVFLAVIIKLRAYPDLIMFKKGNEEIEVVRRTNEWNTPIAAFCEEGDVNSDTPAETLNVIFRPIDDPEVNKGLVWIWPDKAEAGIVVRSKVFETPGLIERIIAEAEMRIEKEILNLFDPDDYQVAQAEPFCY